MADGTRPTVNLTNARNIKRSLPVSIDIPSGEKLARSVKSAQANRVALQALGAGDVEKTKRGLVSALFDQETGVLMAPARAGSAFILDLLGGESRFEELRGQNPLMSALKSARGDFAITGGDLPGLKIEKGDRLPTRLAKYAGALTFDIVTDPTSWVGPGTGTFARKGAAEIVVQPKLAERLFAQAEKEIVQLGGNADKLVDDLFKRSKTWLNAKRALEVGEKVTPGSALDVVKISADGVVDPAVKRVTAANQLATEVGEGLIAKGRSGAKKAIEDALKTAGITDPNVATKIFRQLPDEVTGGLFLKNPITGKPYARIAGGTGAGNVVTDVANSTRLAASNMLPGRIVSTQLSGKAGPAWAAVKQGLLPGNKTKLGELGRTTLLDYTTFKRSLRQRGVDIANAQQKVIAVTSNITQKVAEFSAADREVFETAFQQAFHNPAGKLTVDTSRAATEGFNAARELRQRIRELHQEARAVGVEIGDLGENYVMLSLSDAEKARRAAEEGIGDFKTIYNPSKSRQKYIGFDKDPDIARQLGVPVDGIEGGYFKSGLVINEELRKSGKLGAGELYFEVDPLKLFKDYSDWVGGAIANQKMANALAATGTIVRIPKIERAAVVDKALTKFKERITKLSPQAAEKAQKTLERIQADLDAAVSDSMQKEVADKVGAIRAERLTTYEAARQAELDAVAALRQADLAVRATTPDAVALAQEFRQYGAMGAEQQVNVSLLAKSEATRIVKNAKDRAARAQSKLDESIAAARLTDELGPLTVGAETLDTAAELPEAQAKAGIEQTAVREGEITLEQAQAELQAARDFQMQASTMMGERTKAQYDAYTQALEVQAIAAERRVAARQARLEARNMARESLNDNSVVVEALLSKRVESYVDARKAVIEFKARNGAVKDYTPEQRAQLDALEETLGESRKTLESSIGKTTRKKNAGVGREYARLIVSLADRLSATQIDNAIVMSNVAKMDTLMVKLADNPVADDTLDTVGAIYQAYKSVRDVVGPEELDNLGSLHAKITTTRTDIQDSARRALGEGQARIGASGMAVSPPKSMRDAYAPKGVRDVLENLYEIQGKPTAWESYLNRVFDPLLFLWKTAVTVGRGPGYLFTNLIGGTFNNYLGGVSYADSALASAVVSSTVSLYRQVVKDMPKASFVEQADEIAKRLERQFAGKTVNGMPVSEIFSQFIERGGAISTDISFQLEELRRVGIDTAPATFARQSGINYQFEGEAAGRAEKGFRAVANFIMTNPYQRAMNDAAQLSEMYLRMAAVVSGVRRFGEMDSAMNLMFMLHFDYQDLSNAEIWLKRFVPFYSWTRQNVPLQFRAMFMQHDKIAKVMVANEELKNALGVEEDQSWINEVLPDYIDINGGFATYFTFGGNHIGLFPKLPINDIDRLFEVRKFGRVPYMTPRLSAGAGMLGPVFAPIEFLTKTNFDTGQQYETYGEAATRLGTNLVPQIGVLGRAASAASLVIPGAAAVGGISQKNASEKAVTNLLNLLVGAPYGAVTIDAATLTYGTENLKKAQRDQLKKIAKDANIDFEWLMQKVKEGNDVPTLRALIRTGDGNIRLNELRRQMSAKGSKDIDFVSTLASFGRGGYEYQP